MSVQILMPALSPTMEEGALAKWHVKPGDKVEPGQVIAEIETDKATMEVEAVDEGVVEELLVQAGAQGVKVNTPIARLSGEGEAPAPKPQGAETKNAEQKMGSQTSAQSPAPKSDAKSDEHIAASPLARRLAEQAGIDLKGLKGSGPNGRIIKQDIESAAKTPRPVEKAAPTADNRSLSVPQAVTSDTPSPRQLTLEEMGVTKGSYDLVPLDMMRKTIAKRLTEAARDIPHFPLTIDLEIDALLKARGDINKRFADNGVKISVNDIIIRACALALMRVPDSNASFTPQGIALHHHADIAVAVAIPGGLITPIIRNAEQKGLAQISHEMADLAERARNKKLRPEEYQGGTFSLSNLGMMGIKNFSSILNPPHGMIMSVGAGEKRPIVKNDALAIATIMSVTVTCDHRVVDGAIGAEFLKAFRAFVEDPMAMLL